MKQCTLKCGSHRTIRGEFPGTFLSDSSRNRRVAETERDASGGDMKAVPVPPRRTQPLPPGAARSPLVGHNRRDLHGDRSACGGAEDSEHEKVFPGVALSREETNTHAEKKKNITGAI